MGEFVCAYLRGKQSLHILDIGSYDVNGTYRALFTGEPEPADAVHRDPKNPEPGIYSALCVALADIDRASWIYTGCDIREGPNVDVVLPLDYQWPFSDGAFDVVVSGQTLEHVQRPELWVKELGRILKIGGLACVIAPWTGDIHCGPHYWLIMPDGMNYLLNEVAGLDMLRCFVQKKDCIGIAKKSGETWKPRQNSDCEAV